MSELKTSRSFKFKSVVVTDKKGESRDITDLCASFSYGEKITSPFISGSLVIVDSAGAFDLIAYSGARKYRLHLPIQSKIIRLKMMFYMNCMFGRLAIDS